MKRFLTILIIAILLVSILGITTAFAGVSISGYSDVLAGKTYTYTVKVTATGIFMMGNVKCDGVFSGTTVQFDAGSGGSTNQSLSATVKITVKVSSSATPGQTGRIYIDNASYSYYDDEGAIKEKSLSGSKTCTVVEKAPTPTKDPNATPKPLEGWEIIEAAVDEAEQGALVVGVMEEDYNIPEELLKKAIENGNILQIDFGTYKCTIDPAKLTDIDEIGTLSLKLEFTKVAGLSEVAGELDVYQLHFGHIGELPGMLSFTFEATENEPGDTVYLYYYYSEANVVEGQMKAVVDEDGMVTFDIYHCSSYFVTAQILETAANNFDAESQTMIEELNAELEQKQAELDDANEQINSLTQEKTALGEDLTAAQAEADEFEDMAAKAMAEPVEEQTGFSIIVLAAAVAAAAMLSILLTMLITRSGLFKRTHRAAAGVKGDAAPEVPVEPEITIQTPPEEPAKEEPFASQQPEDEPEQEK